MVAWRVGCARAAADQAERNRPRETYSAFCDPLDKRQTVGSSSTLFDAFSIIFCLALPFPGRGAPHKVATSLSGNSITTIRWSCRMEGPRDRTKSG